MLFNELVKEFNNHRFVDREKANQIIHKMKQLEKENDAYAFRSELYQSQLCYQNGDEENSIKHALRCISNTTNRPYRTELGKSYNMIGTIYANKGNFLQAIDYFLKALDLMEQNQDIESSCFIYNNVACTFNRLGNYDTAIIYFEKALKKIKQIDVNSEIYMVVVLNLSLMYCEIGEWSKAKSYYKLVTGLEKANNRNNEILCSIILIMMANNDKDYKTVYEELDHIDFYIRSNGIEINDFNELLLLIRNIMNSHFKNKLYHLLLLLEKEAKDYAVTNSQISVLCCKIEYCKINGDENQLNELLSEFYAMSIKKEHENEKALIESVNLKMQMQALIHLQQETEESSRIYKEKAEHDELTGLYNRTMLKGRLEPLFFKAKEQQLHIGLIIFDINCFKQFNDCYGHIEGDRCIRELTSVMLRICDEKIHFLRYGGDEFIGFFFNMDEYEIKSLSQLIQSEIRALNIENKNSLDDEKIVSITQGGYLGIPNGKDNLYDFIRKADDALYEGKQNKQTIVFYRKADNGV